jgi:Sortase domain
LPASSHSQAVLVDAPGAVQAAVSSPLGAGGQLLADSQAPRRLKIGRIRVDAAVSALEPGSGLSGPSDPSVAGWFGQGPAPGDAGPAVIIGHRDSDHGPGVFWRLDQVRIGDEIIVNRSDGSQVRFVVRRLARYSRAGFPSSDVFGTRTAPELRLITCDGRFNFLTRQYADNLVVFATAP